MRIRSFPAKTALHLPTPPPLPPAPNMAALIPISNLASSHRALPLLPSRPPLLSPRRLHLHRTLRSIPVTAAIAVDPNQPVSPQPTQQEGPRRYYFAVANAKFMLDEEEHFQELLFERLRNYEERNKEQDFWLVAEPKFLDKFPGIVKRLKRPAVALVSTDGIWITFMKLRLDKVLTDNFEADSLEEALASNPVELQFEKPKNWVAPYPKYESNWWTPFFPPVVSKTTT